MERDADESSQESRELVEALGDPSFHGHRPEKVLHLETHLSHLFIAEPFAYKLKKPVRYSFADFTTRELRAQACEDEVRLNRRLCASIYLGVVQVVREASGRLALGGEGELLDHLVWMRALPASGMLPVALEEGRVSAEALEELAVSLAAFHATAPTGPAVAAGADPDELRANWANVLEDAKPLIVGPLRAEDHAVLADFGPRFLARHATLLHARQGDGRIREGHGDLHAGNVCLVEQPLPAIGDAPAVEPRLYAFDCLEFSFELRCNDVASEIAFLAMDLEARGRPDLGRRFVSRYVEATSDTDIELLLPFYAAYRACIRGMVLGLRLQEGAPEHEEITARVRDYFALATRLAWSSGGPAVIACTGLSGTGKTTLAQALARTTGFDHLATDALRKERFGLGRHQPTPEHRVAEVYDPSSRGAVYEDLSRLVDERLSAGRGVIADATFNRRADRDRLAAAAARHSCPLIFLESTASAEIVRARLEARARAGGSLSDAGFETYLVQKAARDPFGNDEPHRSIPADDDPAAVHRRAVEVLWPWRAVHRIRTPEP